MESQRYKLWHPRAHVLNRAKNMVGDDPQLSDKEKYLANPNYVTEYVGADLLDIVITFSEASELFDTSRFQEANIGAAICAVVGYQKAPLAFGIIVHLIRETEEGCEMRSRFWLGKIGIRGLPTKGILNRVARSKFVAKHAVPIELGRDMVVHCGSEMNHLASFLPDLYADYHPGR